MITKWITKLLFVLKLNFTWQNDISIDNNIKLSLVLIFPINKMLFINDGRRSINIIDIIQFLIIINMRKCVVVNKWVHTYTDHR